MFFSAFLCLLALTAIGGNLAVAFSLTNINMWKYLGIRADQGPDTPPCSVNDDFFCPWCCNITVPKDIGENMCHLVVRFPSDAAIQDNTSPHPTSVDSVFTVLNYNMKEIWGWDRLRYDEVGFSGGFKNVYLYLPHPYAGWLTNPRVFMSGPPFNSEKDMPATRDRRPTFTYDYTASGIDYSIDYNATSNNGWEKTAPFNSTSPTGNSVIHHSIFECIPSSWYNISQGTARGLHGPV